MTTEIGRTVRHLFTIAAIVAAFGLGGVAQHADAAARANAIVERAYNAEGIAASRGYDAGVQDALAGDYNQAKYEQGRAAVRCYEDEVIVWTGDRHDLCWPLDEVDAYYAALQQSTTHDAAGALAILAAQYRAR